MQPEHEHQDQRLPQQVQELDQDKEAVGHAAGDEVARHRAREYRQRIHQLCRADRDVLRQFVPYQPVTRDAQGNDHPQVGHAGDPGKPAEAAITAGGKLLEHVQQHGDDHGVRGVAMQAAHDAGRVPLLVGHVFHGRVRAFDTAVKRDEQVNAADQDHPEQEKRQRAEMVQRIPLGAEGKVEP